MSDFNPQLLRTAREAAGWTQKDLANESGIGQGSVSKYEQGLIEPSAGQVDALARSLSIPSAFFRQSDVRPAAVLYRSRVLKSAKQEATVRARLNLARLAAKKLLQDVEIDVEARFPNQDRFVSSPEQAAADLRSGWWIPPGPIANLTELVEAAGAVVLRIDLRSDDVDAAYLHPLGDGVRWFFINTRVSAGDRVRFSLAHELGHAVMHEVDLIPDSRQAEEESNRFAGAFMLPADELRADLPRGYLRVAHLTDLKRKWRMSMGAIAMRARQIGAISQDNLTTVWKELGWRGYRTYEPIETPVEQPFVINAALAIHREEHGLSDDELAQISGLSRSVLSDLFPENFAAPANRGHLSVVSSRRSARTS